MENGLHMTTIRNTSRSNFGKCYCTCQMYEQISTLKSSNELMANCGNQCCAKLKDLFIRFSKLKSDLSIDVID